MSSESHWQRVFASRRPTELGWYQPCLTTSLDLIAATGAPAQARIIDVGGGASTLVDSLLDRGFQHLTILDISRRGLAHAQQRLGARASHVQWVVADIITFDPSKQWDLWHDRGAFHFLTDPASRAGYRRALLAGLRPGGHVVMATFGPRGPTRCSRLDVVRYGPEALASELGAEFTVQEARTEHHETPAGSVQEFIYLRLQRRD